MINVVSMFGVKIRPHRSLLILVVIVCLLLIFVFYSKKNTSLIETVEVNNDEDINLVDLFNHAFKLIYESGETIKLIKSTKQNFGKIMKKKSFENLANEPVTFADFISHSIINYGLKNKFTNLKVFLS
jgi:hypothetical protein